MGFWGRRAALVICLLPALGSRAQVIDFESGGLHYRTLTRSGLTIMFATLPTHVHSYVAIQVAVSNGAAISWNIKPEDFSFRRADGEVVRAAPAAEVVDSLMSKASRSDVIHLVTAYENAIYGNTNFKSSINGYEARRRSALAEVSSAKLKAAAAASAIALVSTNLFPGDSTDGAVFFPNTGKSPGAGKLIVHAAAETFEFDTDPFPAK
jgi:hypothetical protein